jgi:hypothetical protein
MRAAPSADSRAKPTIASCNASVVNFYNATGSLARFENKNVLFYIEKRLLPTTVAL